MGHIDEGNAHLLLDTLQLVLHILPQAQVQRAQRLVQQQDLGPVHQRPGDGHPLLLAAGQLIGEPAALAVQPHQAQHIGDAGLDLPGGGSHRPHSQTQIIVHSFVADQAEILKDHADGPAHQGDLPLGDVAHGEAVDHHPAPGGHQLAGQELDDGGLAAAGGAHQEHELPVLYLEGNSV